MSPAHQAPAAAQRHPSGGSSLSTPHRSTTHRFAFLAGDRREGYAASLLAAAGHHVATYRCVPAERGAVEAGRPEEALEGATVVVAPALGTVGDGDALFCAPPVPPLPISRDWLRLPASGAPWLIGRSGPWLLRVAEDAGVPLVQFGAREDYALLNAVPTAEGAIAEACRRAGRTAWGQRAVIVGGGRCGEALCSRLAAWHAEVWCADRRPDRRARARLRGATSVDLHELARVAAGAAFLFNTVPAPVVTAAVLSALPPGAVVIDVASAPGGTDFDAARALRVDAVLLPGIPGAMFPATAGAILVQTILDVLREGPAVQEPRDAAAPHPAIGSGRRR